MPGRLWSGSLAFGIEDPPERVPAFGPTTEVTHMVWLLVLLLLLLAIGGGVVVSKLLFLLLVVALAIALFGAFNRSAA
jgi:hypothetical protein